MVLAKLLYNPSHRFKLARINLWKPLTVLIFSEVIFRVDQSSLFISNFPLTLMLAYIRFTLLNTLHIGIGGRPTR